MGRSGVNHAVITVLAVNLLLFLSGLSMSWPSSETMKLLSTGKVTVMEVTWIASLLPAGAAFGPFVFGFLANKIGRKETLLLMGLPFMVGYLTLAFFDNKWLYLTARFICGIGVGATYTITPLYIGEIADKSNRGVLSSVMNISICLGILLTYLVGPFVSFFTFNATLSAISVIYLIFFSLVGIETPYYYISKRKHNLAKITLEKLRGCSGPEIDAEMEDIQGKVTATGEGRLKHLSQSRVMLKATLITMGLFFFQQFTGVNIVMFYSQLILYQAGGGLKPEYGSVVLGAVFFLSSFTCPLLIDKIGRKSCLAISSAGLTVSLAILTVTSILKELDGRLFDLQGFRVIFNYVPLTALVSFMVFFNIGLGPVPNVILGEIFPPNIKSLASSVLISINWLSSFFVSMYIGYVMEILGLGIMFVLFTILAGIAFVFNHFFVIETKGKSLPEIQNLLGH